MRLLLDPAKPFADVPDRFTGYSLALSESFDIPSSAERYSNSLDRLNGQLCATILRARAALIWVLVHRVTLTRCRSFALFHILHISFVVAWIQMAWPNAHTIIAGMKNHLRGPQRISYKVGEAWRVNRSWALAWIHAYQWTFTSFFIRRIACSPQPAFTIWPLSRRLIDLAPKALNIVVRQYRWVYSGQSHNLNPLSFSGLVRASRGVRSIAAARLDYSPAIFQLNNKEVFRCQT